MHLSKKNKEIAEKDINSHVVAVFAFVEKDGKILLAKRNSPRLEKFFKF